MPKPRPRRQKNEHCCPFADGQIVRYVNQDEAFCLPTPNHDMKLLTSLLSLALALPVAAQMPGPVKEHQKLTDMVGVFDAALDYTDMNGKPAKSTGVSIRKQPMGPFWVMDRFQAQMMGQNFMGHGTTGYDPLKKKYVGTWCDSMTPSLMVIEGNFDKTGKILTMTGKGPGMDGKPVTHRLVTTFKDKNTQVFEMFVPGSDGKEMKMMTITYTRRVKAIDKVKDK